MIKEDINIIKQKYYDLLTEVGVKPIKKNNLWKQISDNESQIHFKNELIDFYHKQFKSCGVNFVNESETLIAIFHLNPLNKTSISLPEIDNKTSNELIVNIVNNIKFDILTFPKAKMNKLSDELNIDINLVYDLLFSFFESKERYENFYLAYKSYYDKNNFMTFLKFLKEYWKNNDSISNYQIKLRFGLSKRFNSTMLETINRIKKGYEF